MSYHLNQRGSFFQSKLFPSLFTDQKQTNWPFDFFTDQPLGTAPMGYLAIGQLCKLKAIGQPNGLFYEYPAPWLVKRFFPGEKKPSMLGSSQEKMRHFLALVSPHQFKQIMLCCKSWSAKDTPLVKEILILERSYYYNESAYLFACGSTS